MTSRMIFWQHFRLFLLSTNLFSQMKMCQGEILIDKLDSIEDTKVIHVFSFHIVTHSNSVQTFQPLFVQKLSIFNPTRFACLLCLPGWGYISQILIPHVSYIGLTSDCIYLYIFIKLFTIVKLTNSCHRQI